MKKLTVSFALIAAMSTMAVPSVNACLNDYEQTSLGNSLTFEYVAHSGRTDQNGCHYDRRTGTRHCH